MDKYLVPVTKSAPIKAGKSGQQKRLMKQSSIESLKGIVIVEDIEQIRDFLKTPGKDPEKISEQLDRLNDKMPSRKVLRETKIGHTLKRLTNHEIQPVAAKAKEILLKWKSFYEKKLSNSVLDVQCDTFTERLRSNCRKHLVKQLSISSEDNTKLTLEELEGLGKTIEREVFYSFDRKAGNGYTRTVRSIVTALQHQADLRQKVITRQVSTKELVHKFRKKHSKR